MIWVSDMVPDLSLRDSEHGVITKFSTAGTTIVYECVHVLSQMSVLSLATTAIPVLTKCCQQSRGVLFDPVFRVRNIYILVHNIYIPFLQ